MARAAITTTPIAGGSTSGPRWKKYEWVACDATDHNDFACTGKEQVHVRNSDPTSPSVPHTVKVWGLNDTFMDVTLESGEYATTGIIPSAPYKQTGDKVWIDADSAYVEVVVEVHP